MAADVYKIAEFIAQHIAPGAPFVLIIGGGPGENDLIVTSDMPEEALAEIFRKGAEAIEQHGMISRHKRQFRRRPDA